MFLDVLDPQILSEITKSEIIFFICEQEKKQTLYEYCTSEELVYRYEKITWGEKVI